jgi:hypothetical protein
MSQQQGRRSYDVELATDELDEKGRNGYILTSEAGQVGFYMASFDSGTDYACHSELMEDYANGSTHNRGIISFNSNKVEINSNLGSSDFDEFLTIDDQIRLEEEILECANEATDFDTELENVNWY